MTGVAIVAIPSEDDYVWQISSEKVPHLTLLFLGDVSDIDDLGRITSYLQHVTNTSLYQFALEVDRRGVLGEKRADVVFFKERDTKMMEDARAYLLQDPNVFRAFHSIEQYPSWTPHLTLGYPETPAKPLVTKDEWTRKISWVTFDRIALWTGDYEGTEFRLKDRYYSEEVRMSEELAHFGVKGMKWGVRKSETSSGGSNSRKTEKADRKWEKKATSDKAFFQIYNSAAGRMNATEIDRINNMPQYKNQDLRKESPLQKAYHKEYEKTFTKMLNEEAGKLLGNNASGTKRVRYDYGFDDDNITFRFEDVTHADGDPYFFGRMDARGFITTIEMVEEEALSQSDMEALAHYGVKGMKWGIRRDEKGVHVNKSELSNRASALSYKTNKTQAEYQKVIAKAGGLHKVSNKQLEDMRKRLELEKKLRDIINEDAKRRSEKRMAALKILGEVGKIAVPLILGAAVNAKMNNSGSFRTGSFVSRNVIDVSRKAIGS